jgi:ubiquinone/menaquinone biosynthesis C-methylase UbiE
MLFDRLYAIGAIRKMLWRHWYPLLTWHLQREKVTFLNYAYETSPPLALTLSPADESNRGGIQLYHHVASSVDLKDKTVLEISCGHGGGASYLTRTRQPRSYTGVDLNPNGIRFCRKHHRIEGLTFRQADAERLPFEADSFDVIINIESSHCYADFPRFISEVARVLRPGGHFLYADFRDLESVADWEQALAASSLRKLHFEDISAKVVRGMDLNSAQSMALVRRKLPSKFHRLAGDFAGVAGSRMYESLKAGTLFYRSGCFVKEPAPKAIRLRELIPLSVQTIGVAIAAL